MSPVCAVSSADLIINDLAVLWSKLEDLGNLAVLMLLGDLAETHFYLADMKFSLLVKEWRNKFAMER